MKHRIHFFISTLIVVSTAGCFLNIINSPCYGQYREYYIFGEIVDNDKTPLPEVEISLRDTGTSRSYNFSTEQDGKFKFAGLPHGLYNVTLTKKGYKTMTVQWDFRTPQDRIQKVDLKTIVMISETQLKEIEINKELSTIFDEAKEKIQGNDIDGALVNLDKILAEKPDEANSLYLKGICFLAKKKFAEAAEIFSKVTVLTPSFVGAHYQLGVCCQQEKKFEKALECYKKALELDPTNIVSLSNTGIIYYELKKIPEAISYLEKALQSRHDDAEILELVGLCYLQKENFPKAMEYLEKAKAACTNPAKIEELSELIQGLKEIK